MFERFKLHKRINNIKKELSPREQVLFDTLYVNPNGLTSKECKDICGYSMTGWTLARFNEAGAQTRYNQKSKTYRIVAIN